MDWRQALAGAILILLSYGVISYRDGRWWDTLSLLLLLGGLFIWTYGKEHCQSCEYRHPFTHGENVSQVSVDVTPRAVRRLLNMGDQPTFLDYYRRFLVRLIKGATPWARDNIGFAGAMFFLPVLAVYIRDHGHKIDWELVKDTLWLYLAAFLIYVIYLIIRTPWRMDAEQAQKLASATAKNDELAKTLSAESAARSAAWSALKPTVEMLQSNVPALIQRMIDCR